MQITPMNNSNEEEQQVNDNLDFKVDNKEYIISTSKKLTPKY
jgi:hypothetical protein